MESRPSNQNSLWANQPRDNSPPSNSHRSNDEERPLTSTGRHHWAFIDWENENETESRPRQREDQSGHNFGTFNIPYGMSGNSLISFIEQIRSGQEEEKRGLPKEMIEKIKRMKMGKSGQDCSVCYNGFNKGEKIRKLPCKHIFHDQCVLPWLEQNISCPNCRFNLEEYFNEHPEGDYH